MALFIANRIIVGQYDYATVMQLSSRSNAEAVEHRAQRPFRLQIGGK